MFSEKQKEDFKKDGFLLIKNVLTKDEVLNLRKRALDFFNNQPEDIVYIFGGKTKPSAFDFIPSLSSIFENEKVVELMKDATDNEEVVFGHHTELHYNMFSGWHKDNYGDDDWGFSEDGKPYQCFKIAFYLQDHTKNQDGLSVRKGSHLIKNLTDGEYYDIPSEAGDAILFDMRISHIGRQPKKIEKVVQRVLKSGKLQYDVLQTIRNINNTEDKFLLLFAFGKKNRFIYEHINKNLVRQNKQNNVTRSEIHPEVAQRLEKAGIDYKIRQ